MVTTKSEFLAVWDEDEVTELAVPPAHILLADDSDYVICRPGPFHGIPTQQLKAVLAEESL